MAAVIWLLLGIVLALAELLSGNFVLLMLGLAALVTAGASLVGAPVLVGPLVFGGASLLLLLAVRPVVRRRLEGSVDPGAMHSRALEGRQAFVVARVDGHGGRVKIGGDVWSARVVDGGRVIEAGERVVVVQISGATAVVDVHD